MILSQRQIQIFKKSINLQYKILTMNLQQDILTLSSNVQSSMKIAEEVSKKAQSYIVFGGATGNAKSTLDNYIRGVPLQYQKLKGGIFKITPKSDNPQASQYSKIGNSKQSCTQTPNIWTVNGYSTADLVGWFQTRSGPQDIINCFSNASVLTKGKKIKIVLVCDINNLIVQKGGVFVQTAKLLSNLFKDDFQAILNSTMIVFSKVNIDDWDIQTIQQQVKNIMQSNQNFLPQTKILLENIIAKKRLAIFPTPDKITDHIEVIKKMMDSLVQAVLVHGANVSLSPQSQDLMNKFKANTMSNSKNIKFQYDQHLKNKFTNKTYSTSASLNAPIAQINTLKTSITQMITKQSNDVQQTASFKSLNTATNVSTQIAEKSLKHLKVIQFCRKVDKSFKAYSLFLNQIIDSLNIIMSQLQLKKTALYNQEQRAIIQQNNRRQRQRLAEIQRQRYLQQERIRIRNQQAARLQRQRQQRQRIQIQQRQKLQNQAKQKQLQAAINTPAPVHYVDHGRGRSRVCQIM